MQLNTSSKSPTKDLNRTIALLSDVHDALEKNLYIDEARLVSHHLQQLSTPQFETRIEEWGIEPVLAEMAQGFYISTT